MSIGLSVPASEQPQLTRRSWSVREAETGDRHFVGYRTENMEGRVSSAIEHLDMDARKGVTHSGRLYPLRGAPAQDSDAEYVWDIWAQATDVKKWRDVTADACNGKLIFPNHPVASKTKRRLTNV